MANKNNIRMAVILNKKGFTLIELLIAISIIGILASIVMVSIGNTRERAVIASYKSTLDSLNAAISLCCDNSTITAYNGNGLTETCADATNSLWPANAVLFTPTVTIDFNCSGGTYTVSVDPTDADMPGTACDGVTKLEETGLTFPINC